MWLVWILVLTSWPDPWPPLFDDQKLVNSTLQRAFGQHPPLKAWVHAMMSSGKTPNWGSVDDLLSEYVKLTTRALFLSDVLTIDVQDQFLHGRYESGPDLDSARSTLRTLKQSRARLDPSGGVNESFRVLEAVARANQWRVASAV